MEETVEILNNKITIKFKKEEYGFSCTTEDYPSLTAWQYNKEESKKILIKEIISLEKDRSFDLIRNFIKENEIENFDQLCENHSVSALLLVEELCKFKQL